MNKTIAPVLATLLLLLALACQQSDGDVGQLVDERIADALAAVPTITPQPTATPQAAATGQAVSVEKIEATIESLIGRLATAESKLLAQDEEFQEFISALDAPEADAISTVPLSGSIVTAAIESTTPAGRCWQYRVVSDGTGNTFLVEWEVLGESEGLCFNPSTACAREATVGEPLPRSCAG